MMTGAKAHPGHGSRTETQIERLRQTAMKYRRLMEREREAKALFAITDPRRIAKLRREGINPFDIQVHCDRDEERLWYRHLRLYRRLWFHPEALAIHAEFLALAKQWKGREFDVDLYRVAVHEAGHAIMAVLLNQLDEVKHMAIRGSGGHVVMMKPPEPRPSRQQVEQDIMFSWGGDVAVSLFGYPVDLDARPVRTRGDRAQIFSLARKHLDEPEKSIWKLRDQTMRMLAPKKVRGQIQALALALLREGKLNRSEIKVILNESQAQHEVRKRATSP